MESYGLSQLLKQSKSILNDVPKFKELRSQLRETYTKKKSLLPENFKPKMQKQITKQEGKKENGKKNSGSQSSSIPNHKTSETNGNSNSKLTGTPITGKVGRKNNFSSKEATIKKPGLWYKEPLMDTILDDNNRVFALEFLMQASGFLPAKKVN